MTFNQAKGTSVACYRLEGVKSKLIQAAQEGVVWSFISVWRVYGVGFQYEEVSQQVPFLLYLFVYYFYL